MKKYFLFACVAAALVSCSSDEFLGNEAGLTQRPADGSIMFTSANMKATRADSYGATAAALLGNNFIVEGTKGATEVANTTSGLVFDNYLVVFKENTANSTESNTHNWEYVGINSSDQVADWNALFTRSVNNQTIKYWDYSQDQYDFVAYSTGNKKMVKTDPANDSEVRVTLIDAVTKGYTFEATSADALNQCYVSDIATVAKANYGEPVTLRFKNLGAKVRVGIFETVPGYSVRNVEFYVDDTKAYKYTAETGTVATKDVFKVDVYNNANPQVLQHYAGEPYVAGTYYALGTTDVALTEAEAKKEVFAKEYYNNNGSTTYAVGSDYTTGTYYNRAADTEANATLFGAAMPESGKVVVTYPVVGSANVGKDGYNKASVSVTPGPSTATTKDFGALANLRAGAKKETTSGNVFIGETSPAATFAGDVDKDYYINVMPNPTGGALTLRVNYTLESIDGSGEEIKVWGAKAVVPAIYTQWQPNYAYTYLFKISDKSNGSTDRVNGTVGLFPITFDAVVAEYTDVAGDQTTITTVATPSITTYQKDHVYTDAADEGEYLASKGAIYVMVKKDNGTLVGDLGTTGKLYTVSTTGTTISEATVNDALVMQQEEAAGVITGRNGVVLTPASPAADATITTVVGCDGKNITVAAGEAAKFTPSAATKYAYVYTSTAASNTYKMFQPVTKTVGDDITGLCPLAYSAIDAAKTASQITGASENAAANKAYFSVTTVGANTYYTYVSTVIGKPVAEGLVWVDMSSATAAASGTAADKTFYFDMYTQNDGVYAVKVINVK